MITQLSQLSQPTDPVEALAACAADPPACKDFSTVLVNLTSVPSNRRVLELISGAMAQGSKDGTNPFYASPFAVDVMRIHADADPNAASDLLIQAAETVLADAATAQASQGKDGFFAHVIDGLVARSFFAGAPTPPDLQTRIVRFLQTLAASTTLSDVAQRAQAALAQLRPSAAPTPAPVAPAPVTSAPVRQVAPASIATIAPAAPALSRTAKLALAVGFGVVAIAGVAILITFNAKRTPARAFGQVYRRRA